MTKWILLVALVLGVAGNAFAAGHDLRGMEGGVMPDSGGSIGTKASISGGETNGGNETNRGDPSHLTIDCGMDHN
jgi:hypothetical protein